MNKGLSKQERLIRIELARTRAALERQNVAHNLHELSEALTPAALWRSLFSGGRSRRSAASGVNWLSQILALSRRYPFLLTGASAALSSLGRGRSSWIWRLGLGALAGWRMFQRVQRRPTARDNAGSAAAHARLPR